MSVVGLTAGRLTADQIAAVAAGAGFTGDALITAVAVALAESSGNTRARFATTREDSRGLWQINTKAHPNWSPERLYEPGYNAAAAYSISAGGTSWSPWSAYTSGRYRTHLDTARRSAGAAVQGIAGKSAAGFPIPTPGEVIEGAGEILDDLPFVGDVIGLGGSIADAAMRVALTTAFTIAALALIGTGVWKLTGRDAGDVMRTVGLAAGGAGTASTIAAGAAAAG